MSGRYTLLGSIAKGGMARVHLARMSGSAGFSRLVAIKRLHPELAEEREFVAMLVDEARIAAQLRHTNIVSTLDLVESDGAFSLVLDYVEGVSLSALFRLAKEQKERIPRPIAISILYGMLRGLDAAHDARSEDGHPLGIVHRDVSPQNVLVGVDGIARVIDFGVAKALGKLESTKPGEVRGKFAYMAPEQLMGRPATRQVDVYAAGVILWELLTGSRLFAGDDQRAICTAALRGDIPRPSSKDTSIPRELDDIVARATARDLSNRYLTAREMLSDLEVCDAASDDEVGAWVRRLAAKTLHERQRMIQAVPATTAGCSIEDLMADLARSRSNHRTPADSLVPMTASAAPLPHSTSTSAAPWRSSSATPDAIVASDVRRAPSGSGVEIVAPLTLERSSTKKFIAYAAALGLGAFLLVALTLTTVRHASHGAAAVDSAPPAPAALAIPESEPAEDERPPVTNVATAPATEEPAFERDPPRTSPPTPVGARRFEKPPRKRASSPPADPRSYR